MKSRTSTVLHQLPGLKSRQHRSSFALFENPAVPSMASSPLDRRCLFSLRFLMRRASPRKFFADTRPRAALRQQRKRMPRDHQLLVSWYDVKCDPALRPRYQRCPRSIGGFVKYGAEPRQLCRDAGANRYRVLANAGGEHEGIEPAERSREHPGVESDAIDEVVDREGRGRIGTRFEIPHVVADAGKALEAALAIEQVLHGLRVHPPFREQVEQDPRIDLSRPRAHRYAVEGGEPHRALDTAAVQQSAHRCAAAEMSDDHATLRQGRGDLAQSSRNVFVGEPVKPVPPDPLGMEAFGDRVAVRDGAVAAMEGGVEAGDLRQLRAALK